MTSIQEQQDFINNISSIVSPGSRHGGVRLKFDEDELKMRTVIFVIMEISDKFSIIRSNMKSRHPHGRVQ